MNRIEIKKLLISTGYEIDAFFIDGKPLYKYILKWLDHNSGLMKELTPVDDLAITWTNDFDFDGDARFMRYVLEQNHAITPILSCPDDLDFSCIVIVADVMKFDDKVVWKRIGSVDRSGESFEEEKNCGILFLEAYTQEDWELYGNNIALATIDSNEWGKWISENWSEELFRRRINYTYPYYQNQSNIKWFAECNFEFDRNEYDALVKKCYLDNGPWS